ncbi:hypothetical protein A5784_34865 [Mycobacterium sp. 852013-50091_SCH5140682]|uniref:DUF2510 domain-containing protein n=1 Tax=Mycobacterium sp. 852013-50091_SCH5140682 TaxID=1834109 RepID=UPI0007E990BC|nr:DUF2510 domain-containing protein [Mycobacterium sp. 852013-50091_SCH5140682]OBC11383.1 hypothetical protein A5784_34865 [Mycobacterium sp. 852013-50091_SCH5140682]
MPAAAPPARATPPLAGPGWYPDPHGAQTQRYWDGHTWTDQLAPFPNQTQRPPKSGVVAGLLQLFLGFFGLGRFYLGYTSLGGIQLTLGVVGLITTMLCGIGMVILVPLGIWVLIEGIMMIAGAIPDASGNKLN